MLDLRPWTELTVEAMAETIRAGLIEAGIHTLAWDHLSSEPTHTSTPEAEILIDRLSHIYPHPDIEDALHGEAAEEPGKPHGEEGIGGVEAPRTDAA